MLLTPFLFPKIKFKNVIFELYFFISQCIRALTKFSKIAPQEKRLLR